VFRGLFAAVFRAERFFHSLAVKEMVIAGDSRGWTARHGGQKDEKPVLAGKKRTGASLQTAAVDGTVGKFITKPSHG